MPKWPSSNLLFPESLHHVGRVWLIGRLVTRWNNNDGVDVIETNKPLTDQSSSNMVLDLESPSLTSGDEKSNLTHQHPAHPSYRDPEWVRTPHFNNRSAKDGKRGFCSWPYWLWEDFLLNRAEFPAKVSSLKRSRKPVQTDRSTCSVPARNHNFFHHFIGIFSSYT